VPYFFTTELQAIVDDEGIEKKEKGKGEGEKGKYGCHRVPHSELVGCTPFTIMSEV